MLLQQQPSAQIQPHHRLGVLLGRVQWTRPQLQPLRFGGAGQDVPPHQEPLAFLLPALPRRSGVHRLHGASGHGLHRGLLPRHALQLARTGPPLPLLQLHGHVHGLLRTLPVAAGSRHGGGEVRGHQPTLRSVHERLQEQSVLNGGHGVGHGRMHRSAASRWARKLSSAEARLVVFPQHQLRATGHDLQSDLLHGRPGVAGGVVRAQHGERDHAVEGVLWTGRTSAETRLRGGDDGAAHFDHGHRLHLLVPPTGMS